MAPESTQRVPGREVTVMGLETEYGILGAEPEDVVAACLEAGADFSVTWESLRLDSPPTAPVDLPDPLATVSDAAESLTQRVRRLRPEEMHRIDLVGRGGLGAPG